MVIGAETISGRGIGFEESGKVFHSADEGRTWQQQADFSVARDLMDFFRYEDTVFVTSSGIATVFARDDDGARGVESRQFWPQGFLGQCLEISWRDKPLWLITATDQRVKPYLHVILISDDPSGEWYEWIELSRQPSGGPSHVARLSPTLLVVGTGNHAVKGRAYTRCISE